MIGVALDSGSVGTSGRRPARFDADEPEALPAPVQRHFRALLTDGQPIVAAASIEMAGRIDMSATAGPWKPFSSRQRVVARRPGFLWAAQATPFPGVPAHAEDSYTAGNGRVLPEVLGLFAATDSQGEGEIALAEYMRCFAEADRYPTALLPSQGVRWQAVDGASASATLVDGPIAPTLLCRFDAAGLIACMQAERRGASVGRNRVLSMLPRRCSGSDDRPQDSMLIPRVGELAWLRPEGQRSYFVGHVGTLRYEFLP